MFSKDKLIDTGQNVDEEAAVIDIIYIYIYILSLFVYVSIYIYTRMYDHSTILETLEKGENSHIYQIRSILMALGLFVIT